MRAQGHRYIIMRGSTFIKRFIALLLVVLMSIDAFAAIVGDNDGAAFITKAEFDSMKNDFQSQLDRYNSSLDNKIDGAIASYLAGVRIAKQTQLLDMLAPSKKQSETNIGFVKWRIPGDTNKNVDLSAGFFAGTSIGALNDHLDPELDTSLRGWGAFTNKTRNAGSIMYHTYATTSGYPTGGSFYSWWADFDFANVNYENLRHEGDLNTWSLINHVRHRCAFTYTAFNCTFLSWPRTIDPDNIQWVSYNKTVDISSIGTAGQYQPGEWNSPSVTLGIVGITVVPRTRLIHLWTVPYASDQNDYKFLDYQFSETISGSAYACDFSFRDYYNDDERVTVPCQLDSNNGVDLRWRTNKEYKFNPNHTDPRSTAEGGFTFLWTYNRQKIYNLQWSNLSTTYYNKLLGEPLYKYQGIPICRTLNKPGKLKFKLKFTNKVLTTGATVSPSTANYTYAITDKKFKNGTLPTMTETDSYYNDADGYNHVLKRETRNTGAAEWTTDWIEIDKTRVTDTVNGDYIYIKISPNNADQVVSVEVVDSITYTED